MKNTVWLSPLTRNSRTIALILMVVVTLIGCEPEKKPIAGGLATSVPTATDPALASPVRYALNNSVVDFAIDTQELSAYGLIDRLTTPDAEGYDVVMGLGMIDGWQQSPDALHIGLVLNSNLAPLNDPVITTWVQNSLNTSALTTNTPWEAIPLTQQDPASIRAQLAEAGHPDGFKLVMAYTFSAGLDALREQFSQANFEVSLVDVDPTKLDGLIPQQQAHLILVAWVKDEQKDPWISQVGAENVVELFRVPISYKLGSNTTVTGYTQNGLPIVVH